MFVNKLLRFLSVFFVEVSVVNYHLAVQFLNSYLVDDEILVTVLNLCNFNALTCHCLGAELLLPPVLSCFVLFSLSGCKVKAKILNVQAVTRFSALFVYLFTLS